LPFDHLRHALPGGFGWTESSHIVRTCSGCDEFDDLLVGACYAHMLPPRTGSRNGLDYPTVTTVPFSHDSIAASMMSCAFRASSPEPSISSGRAPARFCSTQRPMRLANVSPKPIMPPM